MRSNSTSSKDIGKYEVKGSLTPHRYEVNGMERLIVVREMLGMMRGGVLLTPHFISYTLQALLSTKRRQGKMYPNGI
jgi:hypothetical protein